MFFLQLILLFSILPSYIMATGQQNQPITISNLEITASSSGLIGLQKLLARHPEQEEHVRLLLYYMHECNGYEVVAVCGPTASHLFDFYLALQNQKKGQ